MLYNIGDYMIGDFIPSHVIKIDNSQKEVTLTCMSKRKDDGSYPIDEVLEAQALVIHGYDNSNVLQGGTVLQSFSHEDILTITDGFESFIGVVVDVIVPEDQYRDNLILYQIKIARYIPPREPSGYTELPDGDETEWDDDWELGYESYNNTGCTNSSQIVKSYRYVPGNQGGVSTYRHEYIQGQPYKKDYGYLMPGALGYTFPYNLVGYTVVFLVKPATEKMLIFNLVYGGAGRVTVGEFGEVIYVPATQIPDAVFSVNGHEYNIPWKAVGHMDVIKAYAFMLRISDVVDEEDILESGYAYVAIRVSTIFPTFAVQSITSITNEITTIPAECEEKDNEIPAYQPSTGIFAFMGGGGQQRDVALFAGYNIRNLSFEG